MEDLVDFENKKFIKLFKGHIDVESEKTRDRILLSAKRRFLEDGFAKVTIGDLCHSMKISKKTFYKHFKEKEDLVLAVLATNIKIFLARFVKIFEGDLSAVEKFDQYIEFITVDFPQNVTTAFMADVQALMPEVWEAIDKFRKVQVSRMVDIIREGQKEGAFNKNFDADIASKFLMLILERVLDPKLLYENGIQLSEFVKFLSVLMEEGIRVRPEKRESENES